MPKTYQVEVFAGCNLRCPLCHAGRREITRDARVLSLEDFKIIFDKISPYAELLYLHIWGEPTLNKQLPEMIQYVTETSPKCVTNISTHGNGLSKEYAEKLLRAGLKQLIVSIDGTNQETYELYRVGGSFESAFSFIKWASEVKAEIGSDVLIIAQCIQTKNTIGEVEKFKEMFNLPGVTPSIKPVYIGGYGQDYAQFVNEQVEVQQPTLASCTALTDVLAIQVDGTIIPCCLYPEAAPGYNLGNILESSVEELFAYETRWEMQSRIKSGDAPTKYCAQACGNCANGSTQGESLP